MSDAAEETVPYLARPTSISFGEGPPQVVVYLEHLDAALAYVREHRITSIEVDTHAPQKQPLQIDFGFLDQLPQLSGLECRMNVSKKTDLAPLHRLKHQKQLGWPARTTPDIDLACFPGLEHLSIRQQASTRGWQALPRLKMLRLSVAGGRNLAFLKELASLARLEVADSPIESMDGIEALDRLEKLELFNLSQLTDIAAIARCSSLRYLYVEKTKRLTDYSPLAASRSLETLKLLTPIDSVDFVPRITSLKRFLCNAVQSDDLSPLLQATSLEQLDIHPEKRSQTPKVAEIRQRLGIRS